MATTNEAEPRASRCLVPLRLVADEEQRGRREYGVVFIQAGRVRRRDGKEANWEIPAETIKVAVKAGHLDSKPVFVDHSWFVQPSLRDMAGVSFDPIFVNDRAEGGIRLYDRDDLQWLAALLDQLVEDQAAGREVPDVGLSLVFFGRHDWKDIGEEPGEEMLRITSEITHIESIDLVFGPGAEGRVKEILSKAGVISAQLSNGGIAMPEELQNQESSTEVEVPTQAPPPAPPAPPPAPPAPPAPPPDGALPDGFNLATLNTNFTALQEQVGQISGAVEQLTTALTRQEEQRAVGGMNMGVAPHDNPRLHGMLNSLDRIEVALDALIGGSAPPSGVPSLTGIRELYHILSGDYEMHGRYQSERVMLASVNSSTMAGLVANALNKRVMNLFAQYPRWWEPAVSREDFASLQDVRWMTLGGVGELPTVAEGAAYTELTWDDQTETDSFVKKGGYLGVTLETIDKDDTRKLKTIPSVLVQGAWLTLSKSISAIFTDNSDTGPAMSDSNNLFDDSNHSNLGTTALSWSGWDTARIAMMKQTELNSSERLGALTRPHLLWVPVDLEATAIQVLGTDGEPGTANNDVNPFAEGDAREARLGVARSRIICNPLWTDVDNWAAQANPLLYPSIGLGYRYGDVPEIFSVASPTAGLMFSNDTMPIKVRYFYAVGPIDWRGLYKMNVV